MDRLLINTETEALLTLRTSKIHIRLISGKRSLTTIEGLDDDLDLNRISRAMKRQFSCSVVVQLDKDENEVIQLQGDHRSAVYAWLIAAEVMTEKEAKERVIIHGS